MQVGDTSLNTEHIDLPILNVWKYITPEGVKITKKQTIKSAEKEMVKKIDEKIEERKEFATIEEVNFVINKYIDSMTDE